MSIVVAVIENWIERRALGRGFIPRIVTTNIHPSVDPRVFPLFDGRTHSKKIIWRFRQRLGLQRRGRYYFLSMHSGIGVFTEPVLYFGLPVVENVSLPKPYSIAHSCNMLHRFQDDRLLAWRAFSILKDDIEVVGEIWLSTRIR